MWRGFPESRRIGKTPLWTAAARLKTDATMKMAIHPAAPEGEMKQKELMALGFFDGILPHLTVARKADTTRLLEYLGSAL
ncbi:Hypothetical predicted protein [Podarcis lilfordi]|uniref:Uncharacterized protein n=1 Tax=Podarcis lilfordi TaxID=74358 RepID=A0AA35KYP2_9SAUR|nr:Hypothetical predicted protein [Podarcis lilfordi]